MTTVKISGSSDDIVCVEGDLSDEFYPENVDSFFVVVSDGTVLKGIYDGEGFWRFARNVAGSAEFSKHEGSDADDDYSDIVTLTGDIQWVAIATHLSKVK